MTIVTIVAALIIAVLAIVEFFITLIALIAMTLLLAGFGMFALPVPFNVICPVLYYVAIIWLIYKIAVD